MDDWRIKKTFISIKEEYGEVNKISSQNLRKHYMNATLNMSKSSYYDFVERCEVLNFIKNIEGKFSEFNITWSLL